jgi:hypothetical protein
VSVELSVGRIAPRFVSPVPPAGAGATWRALKLPRDLPPPLTPQPDYSQVEARPVIDVAWTPVGNPDPELLVATLRTERAAANGGFDHPHTSSGCVFCRRAVAAYR